MLFNSLEYAIFFPIVAVLFFRLPYVWRAPLILAASAIFYMAFVPEYILILAFTILVDYVAALLIEPSQGSRRRALLIASIAANVGVLAFFKYFNFAADTIRALAQSAGQDYSIPTLAILLPIGLSFHTFQSMSYTIEVYRGRQRAEHSLLYLATYVLFFPQLVAGPIERPQNLLPQFRVAHVFDYERARSGFMLIAWGLFKKVAVADRLGHAVNVVYGDPEAFSGSALLLATYFFAVQIYCDFSGYSDIAIGSARVLGFKLMRNFDRPYFSQSIAEFWRRWHISLSTWFRDYVYVPLGGSRVPLTRLVLNLLIVFTLSGLWHGANWTFVVWGALNGIYLAGSVLFGGARGWLLRQSGLDRVPLLHAGVRWAITFHLVLITWVFFRSTSLAQAFGVLGAIAVARPGASLPFDVAGGRTLLALSVGALVGFELLQSRSGSIREGLWRQPAFVRWPAYVVFACLLLLLGDFASEQQFIYFQF